MISLAVSLLIFYLGSEIVVRGASGLSSCLNISRVVVGTMFFGIAKKVKTSFDKMNAR